MKPCPRRTEGGRSKLIDLAAVLALLAGCSARSDLAREPEPAAGPAQQAVAAEYGPSRKAASGASEAAAWPRFHGPKGDNRSADAGLLQRWPEKGPRLVWSAEGIGYGYSGVSIAGGRVYTAGNVGDRTVLTALDMAGKTLWQADVGPAWDKEYPGTRATPTLDGDRLYYETPLGDVVCLETGRGKRIWGLNILEQFGSQHLRWGQAESLLVDGSQVICSPGGPHAVVALDKMTGKVIWKSPSAGDLAGYASPTLAERRGLRMILTMTARAMIGVNADTGELLWRFEHVTPWDENIMMPIYHDGHVFVSTMSTGSVLLRIKVDGKRASVEEVWRNDDLDNHHGGVLLEGGHLYGSSTSGQWMCLDWKTGRTVYQQRGVGKGSLTWADGMLYTLGERGTMALVKATPEAHDVISRFRVPEGGEGPFWAHPVVCGGRLYLRHADRLFAYDVQASKQ